MAKINIKKTEYKELNIIDDNNEHYFIKIRSSLLKFDGKYANVTICINEGELKDTFVSGVIDSNYNVVIPFRKDSLDKQQDIRLLNTYSTLYKGNKAIYGINDEEFYIIDLSSVIFKKGVPTNFIKKIDAYQPINDEYIIMMMDKRYYLYNVYKDKLCSYDFDYMQHMDDGSIIGVIAINLPDYGDITISCAVKKNKIHNDVIVSGIFMSFADDIVNDKDKLIDNVLKMLYSDMYVDDEKGALCKLIQ